MPERVRATAATAAWISAPLAAIVVLHRFGDVHWMRIDLGDPAGWLGRSSLEEALVAMMRIVGLIGAYWLAGSTLLYLLARVSRLERPIRLAAAITLQPIRRAADRLVIGSLAMTTVLSPLASSAVDRSDDPAVVDGFLPEPYHRVAQAEEPAAVPVIADLPFPMPEGGPEIRIRLDAALEVVVRPGDHLWALAERRLSEALGRPAADHEVAPYWRDVVEANRSRIRSGNPDLIHPGEVILLPALEG